MRKSERDALRKTSVELFILIDKFVEPFNNCTAYIKDNDLDKAIAYHELSNIIFSQLAHKLYEFAAKIKY
jgi:hypothetical protein